MNPTLIGIIGILIMLVLFLTRMPVAFVMATVGFVGFSVVISTDAGLVLLSRNIYETFNSYDLTTIPLFILMGQLGFNSGISKRLYDAGYKFLGGIRGGLPRLRLPPVPHSAPSAVPARPPPPPWQP
ncbi:MAG: TRAP transporter large permease subunit [Desulfotignum sp.]|nr:TRAP transporter large permease subunit [Desulfotignum sp.]